CRTSQRPWGFAAEPTPPVARAGPRSWKGREMRRETSGIVLMAAFAVLAIPVQMTLGAVVGNSSPAPAALDAAGVRRAYAALPVAFEVNRGQVAPSVSFVARGSGYAFLVDPLGATLEFSPGARRGRHGARTAAADAPPV